MDLDSKTMNIIDADVQFEKTGLILPPAPEPKGLYKPCLIDGKYLYLSGHGPLQVDNTLIIGRIGKELSKEEGKLAARQVGLTMLATIKNNIGSFNKIKRVIKVLGMVNCVPEFEQTDAANYLQTFGVWITE
jgi:superfamily II helicase